ncbi:hypothetical protein K440DRAFT_252183 [Wilcoxina mikolae CBS 423.85]|nr:hypothetical protein K440DRAFT_252183 [Wilcoxina mikolae CBS 423.85]
MNHKRYTQVSFSSSWNLFGKPVIKLREKICIETWLRKRSTLHPHETHLPCIHVR